MINQIEGYRLSPQQERVWLLQRDGSPFWAQTAILLEGNLDAGVLRGAIQQVIRRHDILRTVLFRAPGMKVPVQAIGDSSEISWLDQNDRSIGNQSLDFQQLFEDERSSSIDVEKGPILRASLFKLTAERHVLIISLPSLYADDATLKNLFLEISDAYGAVAQSGDAAEEVVQYLQFSEWQNEIVTDESADMARDYWRKIDFFNTPRLKLPFEKDTARKASFEPRSVSVTISSDVALKLEAIAEKNNTSAGTLLLACWNTLLRRLTGQTDTVVGVVYDGRKYEELKSSMGLFATSAPVRCKAEADSAFSDFLHQLHQTATDAYDWLEYFSWEDNSIFSNDASANYFPTAFEFQERPEDRTSNGVAFSVCKQQTYFDRFAIKLCCVSGPDSFAAEFHYDSNLFDAQYIKRLSEQFNKVVESVAVNPDARMCDLDVVSDAELQQFIVELNNTASDYPKNVCAHVLFQEQAARAPENIAIVFEDQQLTYGELNARTNQLAHQLRSLGVGRESLVAIYLERSIDMVVSVLGTLKAGGAYVPVDLALPKQRLAFMLDDAQVSVVLTQEKLTEQLPDYRDKIFCLDSNQSAIASQSETNPVSEVAPGNAAYVIYTSGSTGNPKGVVIQHQGLSNYLHWCQKAYPVGDGQGAPLHSPLGFDLTITSLFPPLLAGKKVALVPEAQGIEGLNAVLRTEGDFSLVKITPSHLQLLNELFQADEAAGRAKAFIIGGEALTNESISFWRDYAPDTRLINEYGPTETVVGCCVYEVAASDPFNGAVPIGRPICNTQIFLLDDQFRPVPVGVPGELYIGGDGLARGYLRRPDLTAERFIPNPFSKELGARLYKSGDSARYLQDGNIEYLGRLDHQVKVRGFRIELGEIEAALADFQGVREAVVLAREDNAGDRRLVAYVVPQDQDLNTGEVRAFLKQRLPDYMVPVAFVKMKAFPLTPNGKIDRQSLSAPGLGATGLEDNYVAPRTALEYVLASIWAETIGIEQVGVNDNFFEIGGHSLLGMQVVARVREDFQIDLPVRTMFEGMTVAEMAQTIVTNEPEPGRSEKIAQTLRTIDEMPDDEVIEMLRQKRELDANERLSS